MATSPFLTFLVQKLREIVGQEGRQDRDGTRESRLEPSHSKTSFLHNNFFLYIKNRENVSIDSNHTKNALEIIVLVFKIYFVTMKIVEAFLSHESSAKYS